MDASPDELPAADDEIVGGVIVAVVVGDIEVDDRGPSGVEDEADTVVGGSSSGLETSSAGIGTSTPGEMIDDDGRGSASKMSE